MVEWPPTDGGDERRDGAVVRVQFGRAPPAQDGGDHSDRLRMGWVRPAGGTDGEQQDPVPVRRDGPDRVQAERGHLHVRVQRSRRRDGDP